MTEQTSSRVMLCLLWVKECQPLTSGASRDTVRIKFKLRRLDERSKEILFREREASWC